MNPDATDKITIDLNGPGERVEFLLLTLMVPLWAIVFPLTAVLAGNFFTAFALIGGSFFCFLHFLHADNHRFTFEEGGIRIPDINYRLLPYSNLKRIYLQSRAILGIETAYVSLLGKNGSEGRTEIRLIDIRSLTKEGSQNLRALIHSKLSHCDIAPELDERLANCKRTNFKINWVLHLTDNSALRKCWLGLWGVIACIAYPMAVASLFDRQGAVQLVTAIALHCPRPVKEWIMWRVLITPEQMAVQERIQWSFLFDTSEGQLWLFAALCMFISSCLLAYKLARQTMRELNGR